jgi:hypothetical protein
MIRCLYLSESPKESVQRPSQYTLQNHVVRSHTLKCCVTPYVFGPSIKCYFNECLFMRALTHDKLELNQQLWAFRVPWSPGFVLGYFQKPSPSFLFFSFLWHKSNRIGLQIETEHWFWLPLNFHSHNTMAVAPCHLASVARLGYLAWCRHDSSGRCYTSPKSYISSHLRSMRAIPAVESMEAGTYHFTKGPKS